MNRQSRAAPVTAMVRAITACQHYWVEQHPVFTTADHQRQITARDTRVSDYWEWLVHQIEASGQTVNSAIAESMDRVFVNVEQLVEDDELSAPDDNGAAGRYAVSFSGHVAGANRQNRAAIALDIFHAHQGIDELSDFSISAVDGAGWLIEEDEDHEDGSEPDSGEVEKDGAPVAVRAWAPMFYAGIEADSRSNIQGFVGLKLAGDIVHRLREAHRICREQKFKTICLNAGGLEWHLDGKKIRQDEIEVSPTYVLFRGVDVESGQAVETECIPLNGLLHMRDNPSSEKTGRLAYFHWVDGCLFYDQWDVAWISEGVAEDKAGSTVAQNEVAI
jgi:hypothetical protein